MLPPGRPTRRLGLIVAVVAVIFLLQQYVRGHLAPAPEPTYVRRYSLVRSRQAANFIAAHNRSSHANFLRSKQAVASALPLLCVGMLTVARPSGDVYARATLGSLLAGLSQPERDQLHLMPFIGHLDPAAHPIYAEPWLAHVADRVLTYNSSELLTAAQRAHIAELEAERRRTGVPDREKHLGDYVHLLRVCAATGAPYVLMLEDDLLFLDGWFHRAKAAIEEVERQAGEGNWFYLRLFYADSGFKPDRLPIVSSATLLVVLAVAVAALVAGRIWLPKSRWGDAATQLPAAVALPLVGLCVVLLVCGVVAVRHLDSGPRWQGVQPMPANGCCAQALLYPAGKIDRLASWYEQQRIGFVDTLAERLADEKPDGYDVGTRWALTPVVVQHVGSKSSKGDNWGSDKPGQLSAAETIWNFQFETNDARDLALQRERQLADARHTAAQTSSASVRL